MLIFTYFKPKRHTHNSIVYTEQEFKDGYLKIIKRSLHPVMDGSVFTEK